jgi:amino acid transporter
VLALGSLLIGSYVTTQWFPSQDWEVEFGPFSITFGTLVGAGVLLLIFWVNHFSIKYSARVQQVLGVISLLPIALLLIVPVFEGHVDMDNLTPIEPIGGDWWSWDTLR